MKKRLTEKQIKHVIGECAKGRRPSEVAVGVGMSTRHVQRLYAEFRATGTVHARRRPGRKPLPAPGWKAAAVLGEYGRRPAGVQRVARRLRRLHDISYYDTYRIMRENGLVTPSPAKSRRRKWIRYERRYSNAMWHTDWHAMKHPRFRGLNLITYLDDASRCVVAARLFREATSENAVTVLREAAGRFGTPATILSDNGACFTGVMTKDRKRRRKGGTGGRSSWTPTAFEAELLDRGIELINSRPYHPQTNGKLERFHRTLEEEIGHYESLSAYIEYYNEDRLHWSLDIDNYQTPLRAFSDKKATKAIREGSPNWMEEDQNDAAT